MARIEKSHHAHQPEPARPKQQKGAISFGKFHSQAEEPASLQGRVSVLKKQDPRLSALIKTI